MSVGEEDHVKPAVEAEGRISMWQIAMKPGKPLAFGAVRACGAAWPGTRLQQPLRPKRFSLACRAIRCRASCTFLLFVRPFILRLAGVQAVAPRALSLRADFTQKQGRPPQRIPARARQRRRRPRSVPNQSSAVLTSTVWGDGLIDNPPNHAISAGETVRFIPFSELLN